MKKSVETQARHHVQQVETQGLEKLAKIVQSLEKKRDRLNNKCTCHQCTKRVRLADEAVQEAKAEYQDEFNRMYKGNLQ